MSGNSKADPREAILESFSFEDENECEYEI